MDTSVTIIGLVFMALIGIPLYFVMRGQSINKKKIKTILAGYNHYRFQLTDRLHKKVLFLDSEKKAFLLIDFNDKPERVAFVNLKDVTSVALEIDYGLNNTVTAIAFTFNHRNAQQTKLVPFYNPETNHMGQMYIDEDVTMAQKWQKLLSDCLAF